MNDCISRNIIILGCPRSGKTTLTKILLEKKSYILLTADGLMGGFKTIPEAGIDFKDPFSAKSKKLSLFAANYLRGINTAYQKPFILEGCQFIPTDILAEDIFSSAKCKIVCLGFPNADPDELFESIRYYDLKMGKTSRTIYFSDRKLIQSINSWISYSKELQSLCEQNHIPFYETNIPQRVHLLESIATQLLQ